MRNKLLISLLLIVSSYLTYSLFFKPSEISNNSSKNSDFSSNHTLTSPSTIQQYPKPPKNASNTEKINYNSSNNSNVLSDDTPTIQKSSKPKESTPTIEEINYDSSSNSNALSDDTPISPQSSKAKESTPTIEEINYNSSNNSVALSEDIQTSSTTIENSAKTKENKSTSVSGNISSTAEIDTKIITIPNFLSSLKCTNYVLKSGETLTQIARKYENTCNLNTSIKLIKSINKIKDGDNLNSGVMLSIPESILKTGTMHRIITSDTWYSIAKKHYNTYDVGSITKVLVYINDLPNNDLPLGESIFLPSI